MEIQGAISSVSASIGPRDRSSRPAHSFVEKNLPLPLFKRSKLSVTGETMGTKYW